MVFLFYTNAMFDSGTVASVPVARNPNRHLLKTSNSSSISPEPCTSLQFVATPILCCCLYLILHNTRCATFSSWCYNCIFFLWYIDSDTCFWWLQSYNSCDSHLGIDSLQCRYVDTNMNTLPTYICTHDLAVMHGCPLHISLLIFPSSLNHDCW